MSDKIKKLKANRDIYINRLQEINSLAKLAIKDETHYVAFKMRYLGLESTYKSFEKSHFSLIEVLSITEGADLAEEDSVRRNVDDLYYGILTIYSSLFEKDDSSNADLSRVQAPSVKLPKIKLPTFNGDFKSWPNFYDLFLNLIDKNGSLTNIEKFQYLLTCLSDNVMSIISGLPVTDTNYPIALNALTERFQNKRLLATHYWQTIYNIDKLNNNSAQNLRHLLDVFCENLDALSNLKFPTEEWDFIMFNLLLQKLDSDTVKRFELEYSCIEMPTFKLLKDFLLKQCLAYDSVALTINSSSCGKPNNFGLKNKGLKQQTTLLSDTNICSLCNQNHFISTCSAFLTKTPKDRFTVAKQNKLCVNCLKSTHSTVNCDSTYTCKKCHLRHHTLLHFQFNNKLPLTSDNNLQRSSTNVLAGFSGLTSVPTTILLSTIRVDIVDCRGKVQTVRALLDSGSQTNFITSKCVQRLGLIKINSKLSINGLGVIPSNVSGYTECCIRPEGQVNPSFQLDAYIIPKICSSMPNFYLDANNWSHISTLNLADKHFNLPGEIDMLLGAELFSITLQSGRIVGSSNDPVAMETTFGWVLTGKVSCPTTSFTSLCTTFDSPLDHIIKKFWELEEVPSKVQLSSDDQLCEEIFLQTHYRSDAGRYIVGLPFKNIEPDIADTRVLAQRRFLNLERRLSQNFELCKSYNDFMQDYLNSGHMSLVSNTEDKPRGYYIPHHAVLRSESSTTKLRVVFDAGAKMPNNMSLNDTLLTGAKLQKDIVAILLKFRLHKYVLTADIKQMYRQILIKPEHRIYQKILWRFSPKDPINEYFLNTVTYGVSSAPYLALRTIQQLVVDEGSNFPLASKVLSSQIYVDDILTTTDSIEEAKTTQNELLQVLSKGGFELRKWASNEPSLLSELPDSFCLTKPFSLDMEKDPFIKILGLQWQPSSDSFSFNVQIRDDSSCSKRIILSELARVYDPTGFLSPVTFYTKNLIQQIWTLGLDWDSAPPDNILSKWSLYKSQLSSLSSISIPRQILNSSHSSFQIHGFSDSSEKGYSAVVYIRTLTNDCTVNVKLVLSKSKVAPLKCVTLPRLELCGAVLLSDLISYVRDLYQGIQFQEFAWSDSMVALSWIKSSPHRWKCFIGNRVSHIQEKTSPTIWRYIPSEDNPADCASRGLLPTELVNHMLWWAGPSWLSCDSSAWPDHKVFDNEICKDEERKTALIVDSETHFPLCLLERFSMLSKIKRIIAYVIRFVHFIMKRETFLGHLVEVELYNALLFLVKHVQAQIFFEEISNLKNGKSLSKPLRKLAPFLDKDGILRVGGRLTNSGLCYDKKHPILLPRSHRLTDLIIEDFHNHNLHPGLQTLQFLLNQQFWILSPRRAIRSVLSKCIKCFRVNPKPIEPYMGDLPASRVNQAKPFSFTGVDMAGPFYITMAKRRGAKSQKAYLCLFICFVTKCIHLEVASDLTTECFLAALQRFIGRRGRCNQLFSDQGTNFIGSNRELLKCMEAAAKQEQILWSFNPPSSPHFGGLWESGVKSVKTHFFRVIGNQVLTYEELYTVFVQIEAILNSRPLCSVSSDPSDLMALTPGHFLTLEPLTAVPTPDLTSLKINRLSRWQLIQRLSQDFWKRWQQEYLHSLQQRLKWNKSAPTVEINMLVLIKDENAAPMHWRLARIIELHKGKDGICRVCTVKTSQGTFQRPLVKLCPLPIN